MASMSASIHAHLDAPSAALLSAALPFKLQTSGRSRVALPISVFSFKAERLSLKKRQHKRNVSAISDPQPSSSRPSALQADYLVKKVSGKELNDLLKSERTTPLVVDFYATWCGPCALLAQQLELLAVEYGESLKIVKIDTDEEYELASQLQIRGLPTMIFISPDGTKNAVRTEGLLPNETIRSIILTEL